MWAGAVIAHRANQSRTLEPSIFQKISPNEKKSAAGEGVEVFSALRGSLEENILNDDDLKASAALTFLAESGEKRRTWKRVERLIDYRQFM